ncbi:MAG TPA: YkgJ family cysteine cluster protein [Candidatus Deferrimicrobium sp.]|nr:YkgJ family cysteine cluster protein [Candidatus Deferrimicrobium sp.]
MKLVRDIFKIKQLTLQKEEENWGFRTFLKSCGIPAKKIDHIVHRLNEQISPLIDCSTCGNCCKEILPVLKDSDIETMAGVLKMSTGDFKKKYLVKDDDREGYTFNTTPCPFLENNRCSIFNSRPGDCRSYPHLHKSEFSSRTIGVIHNCSICPIVYNVYEKLKLKIWAMDEIDDSHKKRKKIRI